MFSDFFSFISSFFFRPEPEPEPEPTVTIADIALGQVADTGEFETLVALLAATDDVNGLLTAASDPEAEITVFAPTDQAFRDTAASLGLDVSTLADGSEIADALIDALGVETVSQILSYHVTGGTNTVADLQGTTVTTLADPALVDSNLVSISGSELVDADPEVENPEFVEGLTDIAAVNGIIQVIDLVLLPTDQAEVIAQPTIAEIALQAVADSGEFSTLVAALQITQDAGLNSLLTAASDPNADITVFAPTNAAFRATAEALGADLTGVEDGVGVATALVEALGGGLAGAELVSDVLAYHVLLDGKRLSELQDDNIVETALGGTYLGFDGTTVLDVDSGTSPTIVASDIEASNGQIQVIDEVLLPLDLSPDNNQRLGGTLGDDVLETGSGNDKVVGRLGDDLVLTNDGNDIVRSGSGDDTILAGAGDDRVLAGLGNDLIIDGAGNDTYFGGFGADTFDFVNISGDNVIRDFGLFDTIVFSAEDFGSASEVLSVAQHTSAGLEIEVGDASVLISGFFPLQADHIEIA